MIPLEVPEVGISGAEISLQTQEERERSETPSAVRMTETPGACPPTLQLGSDVSTTGISQVRKRPGSQMKTLRCSYFK